MEQQRMDFEDTIMKLRKLSFRAQCTFLFLYLKEFGPSMCRTVIRYSCMRLDEVNKEFPEGHPYRDRYEKHKDRGKVITVSPEYMHLLNISGGINVEDPAPWRGRISDLGEEKL